MVISTIYYYDKEQHRWEHISASSEPSPWQQPVGAYLCRRIGTTVNWYQRKTRDYGWEPIKLTDVPKIYQLLILLE